MQSHTPYPEAKRLMNHLGLSDAECSVYFALMEKPTGESIETILSQSMLGSHETESALKNLVDKGLVRITSNRLEAEEPKQFIMKIQENNRREATQRLEAMGESASRLLSMLEPKFWESRLGLKPEDLLEPLSDLREMEVRTVGVIADATREVCIAAETFGWFGRVEEGVYNALDRGVKFRVLMVPKDSETLQRVEELKRLGVGVRRPREDWYPVRGTLADETELIFLIWANDEKGKRPKYFRPHFSRNSGMIRVFADAFERRWTEAKQV